MYFAGFVLRDLVVGVLFAVLALAIGAASLGDVHLREWVWSANGFLACTSCHHCRHGGFAQCDLRHALNLIASDSQMHCFLVFAISEARSLFRAAAPAQTISPSPLLLRKSFSSIQLRHTPSDFRIYTLVA